MPEEYKSIKELTSESITERKSEFIAYIAPVSTEEEAISFVTSIKKKHSDATHNVYAYVLRENNTARFSDDGEPHGTAGMPVLELIRKEQLTDIAIVVTRYFGGILLGTGGLVRAYTAAAKAALDKAVTVVYKSLTVFSLEVGYPDYNKVDFYLQDKAHIRDNIDFSTGVTLTLAVPEEEFAGLEYMITELTNGRAIIKEISKRFDSLAQNEPK